MFDKKRAVSALFLFVMVGIIFVFSYIVVSADSDLLATVKINVCGDYVAVGDEECDNYDFAGSSCATYGYNAGSLSCESDCTIDASGCYTQAAPPPNSGGGGGAPIPVTTGVNFYGFAYPDSEVTLLKDAQIAATAEANSNASFALSLSGLAAGNYMFSLYSEDHQGRRSALFTFPVYISQGATTNISGIFIAPTIATDKSQVRQGENISIFGNSVPGATVSININSDKEYFRHIVANDSGFYSYNFDSSLLEKGDHLVRSKASLNGEISSYGESVSFRVGDTNIAAPDETAVSQTSDKGDTNNDGRVNLVDFSVAAYWYKRPSPPSHVDLNGDGEVNLVDFSIMAFYWTG